MKKIETPWGIRDDYDGIPLLEVPGVFAQKQIGKINFLHSDNIKYLRWAYDNMMKGYFHIGIVDPPYGIDVTKMNLGSTKNSKPVNYERGNWDGEVPGDEYWFLLNYVCRDLIVWGGNYFVKEMSRSGRCFIVWDKGEQAGKQLSAYAFGELALTTFDRNAIRIRRARNKGGDDESEKRHDTQKPVYLYDKIHVEFCGKGKKVLDTHGGSFNHSVAAFKSGCELTIMDKCESYYLAGIKNHMEHSQAPRLLF